MSCSQSVKRKVEIHLNASKRHILRKKPTSAFFWQCLVCYFVVLLITVQQLLPVLCVVISNLKAGAGVGMLLQSSSIHLELCLPELMVWVLGLKNRCVWRVNTHDYYRCYLPNLVFYQYKMAVRYSIVIGLTNAAPEFSEQPDI